MTCRTVVPLYPALENVVIVVMTAHEGNICFVSKNLDVYVSRDEVELEKIVD